VVILVLFTSAFIEVCANATALNKNIKIITIAIIFLMLLFEDIITQNFKGFCGQIKKAELNVQPPDSQ